MDEMTLEIERLLESLDTGSWTPEDFVPDMAGEIHQPKAPAFLSDISERLPDALWEDMPSQLPEGVLDLPAAVWPEAASLELPEGDPSLWPDELFRMSDFIPPAPSPSPPDGWPDWLDRAPSPVGKPPKRPAEAPELLSGTPDWPDEWPDWPGKPGLVDEPLEWPDEWERPDKFPESPGDSLKPSDEWPEWLEECPELAENLPELSEKTSDLLDEPFALPEEWPELSVNPAEPPDDWQALLERLPELFANEQHAPASAEPRRKPKKSPIQVISNVLFYFAIVSVLLAALGYGISNGDGTKRFLGYVYFTAAGSADLPQDSLILAKPSAAPGAIRVDDRIAYRRADDMLAAQRVFAIIDNHGDDGQPGYQMARDGGIPAPDEEIVPAGNVVGVVKVVSSGLGRTLAYITRHINMVFLFFGVIVVLSIALQLFFDNKSKLFHVWRRNMASSKAVGA